MYAIQTHRVSLTELILCISPRSLKDQQVAKNENSTGELLGSRSVNLLPFSMASLKTSRTKRPQMKYPNSTRHGWWQKGRNC